ncbi:MAG: hypothetical protein HQL67_11075 [Magnetococcales bacterium]|nr:hypothetical protein [Magnetococcales bacterium]
MIPPLLSDWPAIFLLRSEALLVELIEAPDSAKFLSGGNTPPWQRLLGDFRSHGGSKEYRLDDLERVFRDELAKMDRVSNGFRSSVESLFNRYYEINGDRISPRSSERGYLAALIRKLDPLILIGAFISKRHQDKPFDLQTTRTMIEQSAGHSIAAHQIGQKVELADNHVHLWGVFQSCYLLTKLRSLRRAPPRSRVRRASSRMPHLADFPGLDHNTPSREQLLLYPQLIHWALEALVTGRFERDRQSGMPPNLAAACTYFSDWPLVSRLLSHLPKHLLPGEGIAASLLQQSNRYGQQGRYREAQTTYYVFLFSLLDAYPGVKLVERLVHAQFILNNILHAHMTVSEGLGLWHFNEFFVGVPRDLGLLDADMEDISRDLVANSFGEGVSFVDAKISPEATTFSSLLRLRQQLNQGLQDMGAVLDDHRYQFTVHFKRESDAVEKWSMLREEDGVPDRLPARHASLRKKLGLQGRNLERLIVAPAAKAVSPFRQGISMDNIGTCFMAGARSLPLPIDLTRMVVALDVAGSETLTPPEVFAPVIRWLRRPHRRSEPSPKHPRFRLSVHAGEDFSHILTGMRRIDETLLFFRMKEGDRLGHALAMGINPLRWLQRHGPEVHLTKLDYLDDCVWLSAQLRRLGEQVGQAFIAYSNHLEKEISLYSAELYGRAYRPQQLFDAWKERWRPPLRIGDTALVHGVRAHVQPIEDETLLELMDKYHHDPVLRRRGRQPKRLLYSSNHRRLEEEANLWEAVQDGLIERCVQSGVGIETCPTSNLYLAKLDGYHEHPIFRWYPLENDDLKPGARHNRHNIRNGRISCCVATDNGGLFNVTLPGEYEALRVAAASITDNPERIEQWIDDLQRKSVKMFSTFHLSTLPM